MKREYKCKPGDPFFSKAKRPIIFVTSKGRDTYLWIGNNEDASQFCFATISGKKTLQALANSILAAIKPKKKRRSKP